MTKRISIILASFLLAIGIVAGANGAQSDQGKRLAGPFCINKTTGIVKSVAFRRNPECGANEVRKTGVAGLAGPQGVAGPAGPQGLTGGPGSQGPVGPAGAAGPAGPQGETGATGAAGPAGSSGVTNLESDGPYPGREDSQNNLQNLGDNLDEGAQSTALWTSDGIQQSWVMCAAGKTALGGGFGDNDGGSQDLLDIVTSAPVQITESEGVFSFTYSPIEGDEAGSFVPNGWLVEGFYHGEGGQVVRPHVICANVG